MSFTSNLNVSDFRNDSGSIHQHMNIERLMHKHHEISQRVDVFTKANQDWREDPQSCYRELLDSKTVEHRDVMSVQMFMEALHGTQAGYISRLKQQFIQLRTA